MTAVRVLEDSQRYKLMAVTMPSSRAALRPSPGCRLPGNSDAALPGTDPRAVVLDLMSSWVSHLPEEIA